MPRATKIATLSARQYFGDYSLLAGEKLIHRALSLEFSKLYKIDRAQFLSIIKSSDEDYQLLR